MRRHAFIACCVCLSNISGIKTKILCNPVVMVEIQGNNPLVKKSFKNRAVMSICAGYDD